MLMIAVVVWPLNASEGSHNGHSPKAGGYYGYPKVNT